MIKQKGRGHLILGIWCTSWIQQLTNVGLTTSLPASLHRTITCDREPVPKIELSLCGCGEKHHHFLWNLEDDNLALFNDLDATVAY